MLRSPVSILHRHGAAMRTAKATPRPIRSIRCAPHRKTRRSSFRGKGKIAMVTGPKGTEFDLSGQCSVCGHHGELFDLPGRFEKYCLECSADVATAMLL